MSTEKRTPAFWRAVVRLGETLLYVTHSGSGSSDVSEARVFRDDQAAGLHGVPVPVYHRVIKKPKGHNVWWAAKQLDHNKRVRRAAWRPERHLVPSPDNTRLDILRWLLSQDAADIDATDWELAE